MAEKRNTVEEVFVDTSAWYALINRRDEYARQAKVEKMGARYSSLVKLAPVFASSSI